MNGPRMSGLQNRAIGICVLLALVEGFNALVVGYVLPDLVKDFGVGPGSFAVVFSAASVGTMLGAVALAPLADRIGRRILIAAGIILFSLSTLLAAFATGIPMLLAMRFIAGIGVGCVGGPLYSLATEYSIERLKNTAGTVVASGLAVGGVLCGLLATLLIGHGWQLMFILSGVVPLVMLAIAWRWLPESVEILVKRGENDKARKILAAINPTAHLPAEATLVGHAATDGTPVDKVGFASLFRPGRAGMTVSVWVAMFSASFTANILFSYLATFLVQGGVPQDVSVLGMSLATFGGLLGGIVIAPIVDRSRLKIAAALIGPAITIGSTLALSHFMTSATPGEWPVLLSVTGVGFGILGTAATILGITANCFPVAIRSTAMGWSLTISNTGGFISPLIGGALLETDLSTPTKILLTAIPPAVTALAIMGIAKFSPRTRDL